MPADLIASASPIAASLALTGFRARILCLYESLPGVMDKCHTETETTLSLERASERVMSDLLTLDADLCTLNTALLTSHAVMARLPAA
jgi:hypothetical protein